MICQKCGRTVDDSAAFCPFCGNSLKQQMMGPSSAAGASMN